MYFFLLSRSFFHQLLLQTSSKFSALPPVFYIYIPFSFASIPLYLFHHKFSSICCGGSWSVFEVPISPQSTTSSCGGIVISMEGVLDSFLVYYD